MAMKVNLKTNVEQEMEELLPLSGVRSKTAYINEAVREKNARLRQKKEITTLREYFSR